MMYQKIMLFILSGFVFTAPAMADEKVILGGDSTAQQYVPVAFSLNVGSLGYGVAMMWDTQQNIGITLGYKNNQLLYDKNISTSLGSFKRQSTQSKSTFVQAEWHPFLEQSSLFVKSSYLAFGMAYLQQDYVLKSATNHLKGDMTSHEISPYLGIGVRPMLGLHWGWLAEVGVNYLSQPSFSFSGTEQRPKLAQKDLWLPSAQVGVVYHF